MKPSIPNCLGILDIATLQKTCKAIAAMEAILSPDWSARYYSYNNNWGEGEEVFSMRNGSGDEFFILFNSLGAVINGFAKESTMNPWRAAIPTTWKGVLDDLPNGFQSFIFGEPIKSIGTTFCFWRTNEDANWQLGSIVFPEDAYKDGAEDLLAIFASSEAYKSWALDYYEEEDYNALPTNYFYEHQVITKDIVRKVNPSLDDWNNLKNDLNEIGYPHQL